MQPNFYTDAAERMGLLGLLDAIAGTDSVLIKIDFDAAERALSSDDTMLEAIERSLGSDQAVLGEFPDRRRPGVSAAFASRLLLTEGQTVAGVRAKAQALATELQAKALAPIC